MIFQITAGCTIMDEKIHADIYYELNPVPLLDNLENYIDIIGQRTCIV